MCEQRHVFQHRRHGHRASVADPVRFQHQRRKRGKLGKEGGQKGRAVVDDTVAGKIKRGKRWKTREQWRYE